MIGTLFMPFLMLFSLLQWIVCLIMPKKRSYSLNQKANGDNQTVDVDNQPTAGFCSCPSFSDGLFIVCSFRGMGFYESAKIADNLIPERIFKPLRMQHLWLLLLKIEVSGLAIASIVYLNLADYQVYDIFTHVIVVDAVLEVMAVSTTISWTKLMYYCK